MGLVIGTLLTSPTRGQAQPEPEVFLEGLVVPTNMAFTPDGRLLFTEKSSGDVRVVTADGRLLEKPLASFEVDPSGESGLLGIAVHPDFPREPWIYLYLSETASGRNVLVRVRIDGDTAGPPETLLVGLPWEGRYHNGGELWFAPDGMLLVSVGEGHQSERAQDPANLGGKILRLDPEGAVPGDNPFAGSPVFALGHRNSFGLCGSPDGTVYGTENGPDRDDEVNVLVPGANYGWPAVTGAAGRAGMTDPIAVFARPVALTGCAVWHGELLVGAFNDGLVRRIDAQTGEAATVASFPDGVTDLQVGPDDRLYVATATGIWTLPPGGVAPSPDAAPQGTGVPWVPVVAAIVIVAGLLLRVVAGRKLR